MLLAGMISWFSSTVFAQGVQLFAVLNGGNEVSGTGQAAAGDVNGYGSATVMIRSNSTICYSILVSAIDTPNAAHIHEAFAGTNGGIVISLTAPTTGNPGTSSGCITGLSTTLVNSMRSNPSRFYINVHTGLFPSGAIRGQLF
jgi:hypothetical protein